VRPWCERPAPLPPALTKPGGCVVRVVFLNQLVPDLALAGLERFQIEHAEIQILGDIARGSVSLVKKGRPPPNSSPRSGSELQPTKLDSQLRLQVCTRDRRWRSRSSCSPIRTTTFPAPNTSKSSKSSGTAPIPCVCVCVCVCGGAILTPKNLIRSEVSLLSGLDHENIVRLVGTAYFLFFIFYFLF